MILRNLISLRVFTVYIENSVVWNLHQSEFHFAWSHVNAYNKVTLHQNEILPQREIWKRFEFTLGLM